MMRKLVIVSLLGSMLLLSILILGCIGLGIVPLLLSGDEKSAVTTTTVTLPSGEIVSNEAYELSGPLDSDYHNQLYWQANASAVKEPAGSETVTLGYEPLPYLVQNAKTVYQQGDDLLLVIDSYLFMRGFSRRAFVNGRREWWTTRNTYPGTDETLFLQSCSKPGDKRFPSVKDYPYSDNFYQPRPRQGSDYLFDRIDPTKKIIITKRRLTDAALPLYLAYSYKLDWHFDLEQTRLANHMTPPKTSLDLELSVVTYNGKLFSQPDGDRAATLARPGATEIFAKSAPLSATEWSKFEYSIPKLERNPRQLEALFGFQDVRPEYSTVLLRGDLCAFNEMKFCKLGEWRMVRDTEDNGLIHVLYIRISKESSPR